ncbi:DUF2169 domain-containing protein [Janthinobacterium sp. PC23-8]|uniref:DUF2169 family type VI secretion system accessory protein n=1 Tax=Janthinobacterium sp. PC23-8 TaxID=2012679 RepID=UPI000B9689F0|nr:DUF2169 domain-containing protein [Janthinobacterium sp. PC23-8]OYO27934.1 hypothetical protein CD932_22765 [Janthinobacterium sp. PC23-8]
MKIFRPDQLAILYRSFRLAQRDTLAIGMLGLFSFEDSRLSGLLPEQQLWPLASEVLGAGVILDEGFPKPAAEFKLYGSAHAPAGQPLREMAVAVQLGSLHKQLLVSGDRHFERSGLISATTPFQCMPLTPQQAFGGADYPANLAGKGARQVTLADGSTHWPLPNVESQRQRIVSRGDVAEPAGFWGLAANAPARSSELGQFDGRWLQHSWPHLPDDTGLAYFHSAPPDQRFSAYLQGDECFSLQGLHPQQTVQNGHLPGLRARCFVNRRQADGVAVLSEMAARLETVWLFPEQACGIVLYRAQCDFAEDDAADILHVMAQWENLQDPPQTFAHYQARFAAELSGQPVPPVAAPEPVPPPLAADTADAAVAPPVAAMPEEEVTPELLALQQALAQLEQETSQTMSKYGITQADLAPYLKPPEEPPAPTVEQLEQAIADLNREVRATMAKNNITDADLAPYLKPPEEKPVSLKELKAALGDLDAQTKAVMARNSLTARDIEALLGSKPELAQSLKSYQELQAQAVPLSDIGDDGEEELAREMAPKSMPENASQAPQPDAPVTPPPAASPLREQVVARHAAGQSLAGMELSGVDLSGLDLSGADFSGSLLEKTLFIGSVLVKTNFSACLMQGADCQGADLSGARLGGVSAAGSNFAKARLSAAQLDRGDFHGADFSDAQLPQAVLDGASFENAVLTAAQAGACSAVQTQFNGADLRGADFAKALLTQADFSGGQLGAANFSAAQCEHARFFGCDASAAQFGKAALGRSRADDTSTFAGADLSDAQLGRAAWAGARLDGARLAGASLDDADFSKVSAAGASFRLASATGAKFAKANLRAADMTGINLFKGSLRKARVDDAALHFANLYGVDFEDVAVRAAALEGANIDQTILLFRAASA